MRKGRDRPFAGYIVKLQPTVQSQDTRKPAGTRCSFDYFVVRICYYRPNLFDKHWYGHATLTDVSGIWLWPQVLARRPRSLKTVEVYAYPSGAAVLRKTITTGM